MMHPTLHPLFSFKQSVIACRGMAQTRRRHIKVSKCWHEALDAENDKTGTMSPHYEFA